MSKVAEFLIEAKKLIEDSKHWTQGFFARTEPDGGFVGSNDKRATCWCSMGALTKTGCADINNPDYSMIADAEDILEMVMDNDIAMFNDDHSHEEVMTAWDKAIKLAIEKEAK